MEPLSAIRGTAALLLALALALLLAAGGERASRPPSTTATGGAAAVEPDPSTLARLAVRRTPAVARRVAAIRGLEFERVPKPRVADGERLRQIAERELGRAGVEATLRADEASLRLLGMIEPDADLAGLATTYTELAAAFYDPRRGELFVVADAVPAGPAVIEFVLAHELTHALEDQRFGLPGGAGGSDERALAESALVEGTATTLMSEYAARHLDALELARDAGAVTAPQTPIPELLEAQAGFSYLSGQRFVESLIRRAGSWALVDRALAERAPRTSEQILHPLAYLLDERPLAVARSRAGRRWRELDDDVVGEFLTAQLLRVSEQPVPAAATAGWGGDRLQLWRRRGGPPCEAACRERYALAIGWRWDSATDRREFEAALRVYVGDGLAGARAGAGAWRLDGGWASVATRADTVRLAFAPSRALARRLAAGG